MGPQYGQKKMFSDQFTIHMESYRVAAPKALHRYWNSVVQRTVSFSRKNRKGIIILSTPDSTLSGFQGLILACHTKLNSRNKNCDLNAEVMVCIQISADCIVYLFIKQPCMYTALPVSSTAAEPVLSCHFIIELITDFPNVYFAPVRHHAYRLKGLAKEINKYINRHKIFSFVT